MFGPLVANELPLIFSSQCVSISFTFTPQCKSGPNIDDKLAWVEKDYSIVEGRPFRGKVVAIACNAQVKLYIGRSLTNPIIKLDMTEGIELRADPGKLSCSFDTSLVYHRSTVISEAEISLHFDKPGVFWAFCFIVTCSIWSKGYHYDGPGELGDAQDGHRFYLLEQATPEFPPTGADSTSRVRARTNFLNSATALELFLIVLMLYLVPLYILLGILVWYLILI